MKRFILVLLVLCAAGPADARRRWSPKVAASGYDTDAQAYFNAIVSAGGTISTASKGYVNTFVLAAKAHSYWTKIYRCNPMVGDQLAAALVPLVIGGGNATETNTGAFASGDYTETGATGGLKGNGTSKYFNTGLIPSALGSTTSYGIFIYVKGTEATGTTRTMIGSQNAAPNFTLVSWANGGTGEYAGVCGNPGITNCALGGSTSWEGFLGAATNGSTAQQYYHNGSTAGSPVSGIAGTVSTTAVYVGCNNSNGSAANFSTRYIRGYFLTSGLSATDVSNLAADFNALQTSLSRNTY